MHDSILEVQDLRKNYNSFSLTGVTFSLPKGYIMGLLGPNGAGKSTTIKAIMNLINVDSGRITVLGMDHQEYSTELKHHIGYAGEDQHLYEDMTCSWIAKFVSKYYKTWDSEYYQHLLDKFNLNERKKIKQLSKGMKVKFAITLALAHKPELLILDEPTSGLDPIVRHELLQEMLDVIQDESRSILFSSHITEDIQKIADYITIIDDGRVLVSDDKDSLMSKHRRVIVPKELAAELDANLFICTRESGTQLSAVTTDFLAFKEACVTKQGNYNVESHGLTLDEVFRVLVKGEF